MQGLGPVYLMNNVHFLVRGVQNSRELGGLGADWVEASSSLVQRYAEAYLEAAWGTMRESIKDSPASLTEGKTVTLNKERVRSSGPQHVT